MNSRLQKDNIELNSLSDIVAKIRTENKLEQTENEKKKDDCGIVDIMTFCNRADLLDLPGNNLRLFLSQRVILKSFYMGSRGNENISLTEEEWNWLYTKQQNSAIAKIKKKISGCNIGTSNFNFHELNLACGRRGSKTLLASIVCVYEAYKLLKLGDPYKFYGLPMDKEIAIINVANSQKQAGRLFADIKARVRNGPFFRGRVQNKGESSSEIRLYTDVDLDKIKTGNYNIAIDGSVVLVCGHSNPDTLRGYASVCIIFDELQYYTEHPVVSGREFYNALTASVAEFRSFGDGRTIEISTTGSPTGMFYNLHLQGMNVEDRFNKVLGYHLATWDINDKVTYEDLSLEREKDPESFDVEFGARWALGGFVSRYFPEDKVRRAFKPDMFIQNNRMPDFSYFMHLDPAATHDNYSLVVIGKKGYITSRGERRFKIFLAYHKNWKPAPGIGLNIMEIDDYAWHVARVFRPNSITYDVWNSVHSINYLTQKGFYATQLPFGRGAKALYYRNLLDIMDRDELELYYDEQLMGELLNIKYRPTQRGITLFPDPQADVSTDDLVDCLVGACWMAVGRRMKDNYPVGSIIRIGYI